MSEANVQVRIVGRTYSTDLLHIVCEFDDNTAHCGEDVTDSSWEEEGLDCVMCMYLDRFVCVRCGT